MCPSHGSFHESVIGGIAHHHAEATTEYKYFLSHLFVTRRHAVQYYGIHDVLL
jgi:hypothetical protein